MDCLPGGPYVKRGAMEMGIGVLARMQRQSKELWIGENLDAENLYRWRVAFIGNAPGGDSCLHEG